MTDHSRHQIPKIHMKDWNNMVLGTFTFLYFAIIYPFWVFLVEIGKTVDASDATENIVYILNFLSTGTTAMSFRATFAQ